MAAVSIDLYFDPGTEPISTSINGNLTGPIVILKLEHFVEI